MLCRVIRIAKVHNFMSISKFFRHFLKIFGEKSFHFGEKFNIFGEKSEIFGEND